MKKLYLLGGIILLGCAPVYISQEEVDAIKKETVYPYGFDKVWSATVEALADMEVPIESIEKESGLITTDFIRISSKRINQIGLLFRDDKYMIPGSGGYSFSMRGGRYKLNVFEYLIDSLATKVKVTVHIEVYYKGLDWTPLKSRGEIEREIFEAIQQNLEK